MFVETTVEQKYEHFYLFIYLHFWTTVYFNLT